MICAVMPGRQENGLLLLLLLGVHLPTPGSAWPHCSGRIHTLNRSLEHCIANLFFVPLGIFVGEPGVMG